MMSNCIKVALLLFFIPLNHSMVSYEFSQRLQWLAFLTLFTILILIWGLKDKGLTPDIQWSILKRSSTPKSFDSRCNLCLEEKIHILLFPEPKKLLNKRNELIARCRHRAKFKL